jgi:hypothetical protein
MIYTFFLSKFRNKLCRFPIVEREFLAFKYGSQSDGLTQKGVIYAKVKINGAFLHLFTTHLQASYHDISSKRYVIGLISIVFKNIRN